MLEGLSCCTSPLWVVVFSDNQGLHDSRQLDEGEASGAECSPSWYACDLSECGGILEPFRDRHGLGRRAALPSAVSELSKSGFAGVATSIRLEEDSLESPDPVPDPNANQKSGLEHRVRLAPEWDARMKSDVRRRCGKSAELQIGLSNRPSHLRSKHPKLLRARVACDWIRCRWGLSKLLTWTDAAELAQDVFASAAGEAGD